MGIRLLSHFHFASPLSLPVLSVSLWQCRANTLQVECCSPAAQFRLLALLPRVPAAALPAAFLEGAVAANFLCDFLLGHKSGMRNGLNVPWKPACFALVFSFRFPRGRLPSFRIDEFE